MAKEPHNIMKGGESYNADNEQLFSCACGYGVHDDNNEVMNQIIAFYRDMNGMLTLWVPTQLMVEVLVQARSLLQQQTMASTP